MRIYLDNCCLNRPFDDMQNESVRLEAEAVLSIIDFCERGDWELWLSDALIDEINRTANLDRWAKVLLLCKSAVDIIKFTPEIYRRAAELGRIGIKPYDALHVASAEVGQCDVLLTTDRRLISAAKRTDVNVRISNPLLWLMEVLYDIS